MGQWAYSALSVENWVPIVMEWTECDANSKTKYNLCATNFWALSGVRIRRILRECYALKEVMDQIWIRGVWHLYGIRKTKQDQNDFSNT